MKCILTPRALKGLLRLGAALLGVGLCCHQTQLVLNQSPSLGHKAFLIIKGLPAYKGGLVSFRGHKTKYFNDVIFTKRIIGVEGDKIALKNKILWVEDTPVSPLLSMTDKGQPLVPLEAAMIPKGFVFVSGDHPHSFDSRYEEFGLVSVHSLIGRTFAVW